MYKRDRDWADSYESQVLIILNTLISHLAMLSIATDENDKKFATDIEVKLKGGTIAVRLRRPYYDHRDLTIRSSRSSGVETELAKIKAGFAYRYFYGWTNTHNIIEEWMLVDLDKVRAMGLLENREEIPNTDGKTAFIAISAGELQEAGCLIANNIKKMKGAA